MTLTVQLDQSDALKIAESNVRDSLIDDTYNQLESAPSQNYIPSFKYPGSETNLLHPNSLIPGFVPRNYSKAERSTLDGDAKIEPRRNYTTIHIEPTQMPPTTPGPKKTYFTVRVAEKERQLGGYLEADSVFYRHFQLNYGKKVLQIRCGYYVDSMARKVNVYCLQWKKGLTIGLNDRSVIEINERAAFVQFRFLKFS